MTSEAEVGDPLLRAIAELRMDLKLLIDEQVALLKERVEESTATPPRAFRAEPIMPAVPAAEVRDEAAKGRSLDPRQRLDALAKHLDHRLRQANAPAPDPRAERPTTDEGP